MSRFLLALCLVLLLVALVAGTLGALAYGADAEREGELEIVGVRQPVVLSWDAQGSPTIEAASLPDLALGLGYAHAADHAWTMALWRQAGRGGLRNWFGAEMRPLDRHARALGFDALAQQTYRSLDEETRTLLDAYARGVNAAMTQPGVAQGDAFVLMDVKPDTWAPWDALVVERLLAYLATPATATDSTWARVARQDSTLRPFLSADSTFRSTLGIGGTDQARAFTAPSSDGPTFVVHQPMGTSALPAFAPVTLTLGGRTTSVMTLPGTLSIPVGWDGSRGWSVFLTSSMRLDSLVGPAPPMVHSRIVERNGDEVLVEIPRDTSGLVLSPPLLPADSLSEATSGWRVRWSGFRPGTDLLAFRALLSGSSPPPFTLLRGDGLLLNAGEGSVLGSPPVSVITSDALFVGATPEAQRAAEVLVRLHARADSSRPLLPAAALARSDISLWAAERLPPLLQALGDRSALDPVLETPYAVLKGWTFRYESDAIAPSIFEAWLENHRTYTGHLPDPSDSLDVLLLPHTLRIARASLRDTYGTELIDWQWGQLQGGFSVPLVDMPSGRTVAHRFIAPTEGTGGHPSSLFPGPSEPHEARSGTGVGPATWTSWSPLSSPELRVRSPLAQFANSNRSDPAIFRLGETSSPERDRLTIIPPS